MKIIFPPYQTKMQSLTQRKQKPKKKHTGQMKKKQESKKKYIGQMKKKFWSLKRRSTGKTISPPQGSYVPQIGFT